MIESGEIDLGGNVSVVAWWDRMKDVVCIAVRHIDGEGKRGGMIKLSLEALSHMEEAEEFPTLTQFVPDSPDPDTLFK